MWRMAPRHVLRRRLLIAAEMERRRRSYEFSNWTSIQGSVRELRHTEVGRPVLAETPVAGARGSYWLGVSCAAF